MAVTDLDRLASVSTIDGSEGPTVTLGHLARLTAKEGDVFVLRTPATLTQEARALLREQWEQFMPGHKCLVLDGGMDLGVVEAKE